MTNPFYVDSKDIQSQFRGQNISALASGGANIAKLTSQFGPAGTAVGVGLLGANLVGNTIQRGKAENELIDNLRGYSAGPVPMGVDGQPIYSLGQDFANLQEVSVNSVGKGIGNAIFGGKKRRRKAKRAKDEAFARIEGFQNNFNDANLQYNQQQSTKEEYFNDMQDRFSNMYSAPRTFI